MTVSTSANRADYLGNSVTTAFAVPFYFPDPTNLQVLSTVIATGVSSTLVLNSDYTVTGAGVSAGGTVTAAVAPAAGVKLSILLNLAFVQNTHYVPNDPFPAASHEAALDYLTLLDKQTEEQVSRALQVPAGESGTVVVLPLIAQRANKLLSFDSNGNPVAYAAVSQDANAVSIALGNYITLVAGAAGDVNVGHKSSRTGPSATTVFQKLDGLTLDLVADFGADPTGVAAAGPAMRAAAASGANNVTVPPFATFKVATSVPRTAGQNWIMWGATFNCAVDCFTWSGSLSNGSDVGGTFNGTAANARAFAAANSSITLNGWTFRGINFNKTLTGCIDGCMILSRVEDNFFGTPGGTRASTHRHLNLVANPAGSFAVNQNYFKGNRFNNATAATPAVFIQYGSGNTFISNDFESNDGQALHVDGGGVTNLVGNWFESNGANYQVYFECTGAITNSLYYNRAINATGNVFNMLAAGNINGAAFFLDANSLNLAMEGNSLYTNQTGVKVTVSTSGTNGGIVKYLNNSNYSASVSEISISSITNLYAGFNGFNVLDRAGGASLFSVSTGGTISTGTSAGSPYTSTTVTAANLVVLSNGILQRSTSLRKYKKNIRRMKDGLAKLLALKPVTYQSRCVHDGDRTFGGFIVDDFMALGLWEFVEFDERGNPVGLMYGHITALLAAGFQEHVTTQDKANRSMLKRITRLEKAALQ